MGYVIAFAKQLPLPRCEAARRPALMGKSGSAARPALENLLHREEVKVATKLTLVSVRIA